MHGPIDSRIPNVLIVDHTDSACAHAFEFLGGVGFQVERVLGVDGALSRLNDYSVDIVLLDVDILGVDGCDICQQIRAQEQGATVPILVVSEFQDSNALNRYFLAGATDVSIKPVHWLLFPIQIRNMLHTADILEALGQTRTSLDVAQRMAGLGNWEHIISSDELLWSDNLYRLLDLEPQSQKASLALYLRYADKGVRKQLHAWLTTDDPKRSSSFKHSLTTDAGEERYVKIQIRHELDTAGNISRKWGVVHDVTEQYEAEQKIHQLAYYDSLTCLPNRALFCERLAREIALAKREATNIAVLFLDLDNFKRVNDSLGHAYGDLLLQEVGERLQSCAQNMNKAYDNDVVSCSVARMGGDEFTVLLRGVENRDEVIEFTNGITESLSGFYELDENDCHTSPSVGISFFPEHGTSVDELLKTADVAMYGAKKRGKGCYQIYSSKMDENSIRRYRIEELLRSAIENDELLLHFQPQMNLDTGLLESVEALVRWNSKELGFVSPGDFIPLAEDSGLIVPIGEWVLKTACNRAKQWIDEGVPLLRVAVNISVIEFMRPDFVNMVNRIVGESGLDPSNVELEITESILIEDTQTAINSLTALKEQGFLLSIDDFGTGFSSLSQLKHFPIDRLKIDQSFVQGMLNNIHDKAIVKAVLTMANSMNLKVIAEGVETVEQLELLSKIQCDEAQGFFLSRPVPTEDIAGVFYVFNNAHKKRTGTDG